jgi:hypothetical protein
MTCEFTIRTPQYYLYYSFMVRKRFDVARIFIVQIHMSQLTLNQSIMHILYLTVLKN